MWPALFTKNKRAGDYTRCSFNTNNQIENETKIAFLRQREYPFLFPDENAVKYAPLPLIQN